MTTPETRLPQHDQAAPGDLGSLWREQEVQMMNVTVDSITRDVVRFQGRIRRRNALEYAAGGVAAVLFSRMALDVSQDNLVRTAALVTLTGVVVVVTHLRVLGRASSWQPDLAAPTRQALEFHRRELERQRTVLGRVPRWYVGPLVPGLALFEVAAGIRDGITPMFFVGLGAIVATLMAVILLNRRSAKKLSEQIEALPRDLDE